MSAAEKAAAAAAKESKEYAKRAVKNAPSMTVASIANSFNKVYTLIDNTITAADEAAKAAKAAAATDEESITHPAAVDTINAATKAAKAAAAAATLIKGEAKAAEKAAAAEIAAAAAKKTAAAKKLEKIESIEKAAKAAAENFKVKAAADEATAKAAADEATKALTYLTAPLTVKENQKIIFDEITKNYDGKQTAATVWKDLLKVKFAIYPNKELFTKSLGDEIGAVYYARFISTVMNLNTLCLKYGAAKYNAAAKPNDNTLAAASSAAREKAMIAFLALIDLMSFKNGVDIGYNAETINEIASNAYRTKYANKKNLKDGYTKDAKSASAFFKTVITEITAADTINAAAEKAAARAAKKAANEAKKAAKRAVKAAADDEAMKKAAPELSNATKAANIAAK